MKKITQSRKRNLDAKWPFIFGVFLLVSLAVQTSMKIWASDVVMEWTRLTFGMIAASIATFLSMYSLRRLVFTWKIGSMEGWRRTHMYLGIFCVALVLLHTNFKVYGNFGVILITLLFLVTLSGIMGEIMYRTIPVWLSKQGSDALELDTVRKERHHYLLLADEIAGKTSGEFKTFYGNRIRRMFAKKASTIRYLVKSEDDLIFNRKKIFDRLSNDGPKSDRLALSKLESLFADRDKVEYRYSRLQALRWWNIWHGPITAAFITAIAIHIWSITYY